MEDILLIQEISELFNSHIKTLEKSANLLKGNNLFLMFNSDNCDTPFQLVLFNRGAAISLSS